MDRWKGRVAMVTGASVGIGRAIAVLLANHGLKVAVCARNLGQLQSLADEVKSSPGQVLPIQCDLRNEKQILQAFAKVKETWGGLDILINNAGLAFNTPLLSGATEQWREQLDVNVLALCVCTREAVKSMKERNVDDGHVINISSMGGHRLVGNPSGNFYSATKFAVRALTEGLRAELREIGSRIRVSSVSPGMVETEFQQRMYFDDKEKLANISKNRTYKVLQSQDIADAVIYALSAPPHVSVHDILMRPTEQVK